MTLQKLLALSCLLLPMIASAHSFETNQRVPPVGIADRGELILDNDKFSYKSWNSAQLPGKSVLCNTSLDVPPPKRKMRH